MSILSPSDKSCLRCNHTFTPRNTRQKYCSDCIHAPCEQCEGHKNNARSRLCRKCFMAKEVDRTKSFATKIPLDPMDCPLCSNSFIARNAKQKYCSDCIHRPCSNCGAKKDVRADFCKKCDSVKRIGKTRECNRREIKTMEQVMAEVESIGLLPENQYAFGYVIGVTFGDGCVSKITERHKFTCQDGTITTHIWDSHRICLEVTSQAFAEQFIQQWSILTGRYLKIRSYIRTNFDKSTLKGRPDEYSLQLFCVSPRHTLLGPYLSHLKYESEVYELLRFPLEVIRGFVHGMIDSEGYVANAYIDITNKKATLLDVMVFMFEQLGHDAIVYTSPSSYCSHLRVTTYKYRKYIG